MGIKNSNSQKVLTKMADFIRGIFDMGNTNPKKFFDFDHGKVPYEGIPRKCLKNFVFPESGSGKHFHSSTVRAKIPHRVIFIKFRWDLQKPVTF